MNGSLKFHLGARVWLKIDPEIPGLVTGLITRPTGYQYLVTWSDERGSEDTHYDIELTSEPEPERETA